MGSRVVVLILGCGSWSDGCGSWSDGPMVGNCGPMVISRGFDSLMVVVLVPRSRCNVFNGLDFFFSTIVCGCEWIWLVVVMVEVSFFFFFSAVVCGCGWIWRGGGISYSSSSFFFFFFFLCVSCGMGGRFVVVVVWVVGFWWVVGWWVLW